MTPRDEGFGLIYMIDSARHAPKISEVKVSTVSRLGLTLVIAACVALSGCNPTGAKSQAPSPGKEAKGAAPVAQTANPGEPVTGGGWQAGPWQPGANIVGETMYWDDGRGQYLRFSCSDELFAVEARLSMTVTGKPPRGRLYFGGGSNDGQAKVYSGLSSQHQMDNTFVLFPPFTAAFLKVLESSKNLTVEIDESRITPNPPPKNVLKSFIAGCGNWKLADRVTALENLPFPKNETANGP